MSELIDVAEDVQEAATASVLISKAKEVQKAAAEAALAENAPKPSMGLDRSGISSDYQAAKYNNNDWPDNPTDHHAISGIPEAFAYIAERNYSGLPAKKAKVNDGKGILELSQGAFDNLTDLLRNEDKFDGDVIKTFCTFLESAAVKAEDQALLARELAAGVKTQQKILQAAEHEAMGIAKKTIEACKRIEADEVSDDLTVMFTVAAIGVSITGAAFSGGLGFAIAGAVVTGAQGAYTVNDRPVGDEEVDGLDGDTLETVLNGENGMYALLEKAEQDLKDAEFKLANLLWRDLEKIDGKGPTDNLGSYQTRPGRLVEGRGDFHTTGAVKGDLKDLYRYATGYGSDLNDNIPQLAKDILSANQAFSKASGEDMGAMGPAAVPWEMLLDALLRLTAKASNDLYDGGEVLGRAAQDFAEQDGDNADSIDKNTNWMTQPTKKIMNHADPDSPPPSIDPSEIPDYYVIEEGPNKGKQIPNLGSFFAQLPACFAGGCTHLFAELRGQFSQDGAELGG